MKNDKIGIIFLGLIIALAGLGGGYAAWSDTITIYGTISTGSVSWEVIDYSGTWAYKDLFTDECIISDIPLYSENLLLVAYAEATPGIEDCDVYVVFDNLFPCIWFKADFVIRYTGTIPGKISGFDYSFTSVNNWIEELITSGDIYVITSDINGNDIELGYQLHENDEIRVEYWIHILQQHDLMNVTGSFRASFEVTQWNEYKSPSGSVPPSGGTPRDISDFVIYQTSSSGSYTIPQGTILNPGDYVIIARDSNKIDFENYWGILLPSNVIFLTGNNELPSINGDETYEIRDNNDIIVDGPTGQPMVVYNTVERIYTTSDPTLSDSWNINSDTLATPGSGANGNGLAGLVINEYSDTTGTGNWKYEFIELFYDAI
jgi:hypothetical protein